MPMSCAAVAGFLLASRWAYAVLLLCLFLAGLLIGRIWEAEEWKVAFGSKRRIWRGRVYRITHEGAGDGKG